MQDFDQPFEIRVSPVDLFGGLILLILSEIRVNLKYPVVSAVDPNINKMRNSNVHDYTYSLDHYGSCTFTLLYWLYSVFRIEHSS